MRRRSPWDLPDEQLIAGPEDNSVPLAKRGAAESVLLVRRGREDPGACLDAVVSLGMIACVNPRLRCISR
jgi:hypothetical protein